MAVLTILSTVHPSQEVARIAGLSSIPFLKEVKGKRGAAEECSESGAPEILQVAAVGLEQVVYERKGVFDYLIPL